jgi:predicted nucleic acid-binding protein
VIALDSSVAIPALRFGHPSHRAARSLFSRSPSLPVHAAFETYAAMTRIAEIRIDPAAAAEAIEAAFGSRLLPSVPPRSVGGFLSRMAAAGVSGGAIYDALVAESARLAGATLVTADRRAAATYEAVGVGVELFGAE